MAYRLMLLCHYLDESWLVFYYTKRNRCPWMYTQITKYSIYTIYLQTSSAKCRLFCPDPNVLTFLATKSELGQYHSCWCPGSCRRQGISRYSTEKDEKWILIVNMISVWYGFKQPSHVLQTTQTQQWLWIPCTQVVCNCVMQITNCLRDKSIYW